MATKPVLSRQSFESPIGNIHNGNPVYFGDGDGTGGGDVFVEGGVLVLSGTNNDENILTATAVGITGSFAIEVGSNLTLTAGGNMVFDCATFNFSGGQIQNIADPTSAQHAVTLAYLQAMALNQGRRSRVRAATTSSVTISTALNNGDTLDGVTLATDDLVLVKDQSSAAENGIYVVGASPARATEFDSYNEHPGSTVVVQEGTANLDSLWMCTSNEGGTLNSTAIVFSKLRVTGELLAVNDLSDLANKATARQNLDVEYGVDVQAWDAFLQDVADLTDPGADRIAFWDDSDGHIVWLTVGSGLSISGTTITATGSVVKYTTSSFGDNTVGPFTITHNLGTRAVTVSLIKTATPYGAVDCAWAATTTNTITLSPDVAIASGEYTVTVVG